MTEALALLLLIGGAGGLTLLFVLAGINGDRNRIKSYQEEINQQLTQRGLVLIKSRKPVQRDWYRSPFARLVIQLGGVSIPELEYRIVTYQTPDGQAGTSWCRLSTYPFKEPDFEWRPSLP